MICRSRLSRPPRTSTPRRSRSAGYLQRLRDRAPELFAAGRPAGYGHTVATVWSLAFEQLAEQPVAAELVRVCAHLAPERIPRELLDAYTRPRR